MMIKPTESPLKVLSDERYVQRRLNQSPFDSDYLHLADLTALVCKIAPEVRGTIFDYGSGGAPYASLFSQCADYVAADLEPGPKVDRVLQPDGMTSETGKSYDFVLSTQVLEHVKDPHRYLLECHRILRPGGRILLTTHGMVVEHGCPHDYRRWTAHGLEDLFLETGFQIIQSGKLTTQIRGIVQLINMFAPHLRCPNRRGLHLALSVVRKLYLKALMPLLNKFADLFEEQSVVDATAADCIYVAVFVHAQKLGNGETMVR
jgi:SAM-dependent methyltransferase